jgi:uncharacterized membrane protein (UPF0127 family)
MAWMGHSMSLMLLSVMLAACRAGDGTPAQDTAVLEFAPAGGTVRLEVEIADEPSERARGLMGRASLPEDRGMAFLFDGESTSAFWMKDTLIPLSIGFWDRAGRIVAMVDMPPCEADPCPKYGPGVPYVGAVEVNLGWFERSGVDIGDRVELHD